MLKIKEHSVKQAFTIVELTAVIVILGILTGIVSVTYIGAKQKAITTSVKYDLYANSSQLRLYATAYKSYPTALSASNCPTAPVATPTSYCLTLSSGNVINTYTGTQSTFLLKIQNTSTSIMYQISESTGISMLAPLKKTII